MFAKRKLLKSAGLIGIITIISRVLGLIRDAVIASGLGAGYISDCFQIAFEIPSLMRRVLGEGSLSAFIVPVFTKKQHQSGAESAWRFAANAFNIFFLLSFILTCLGIIFARDIFVVFGGMKYVAVQEYQWLELGTNLTRIMFPFLLLLTLVSLSMGLLHSQQHFTLPALNSVFFNLTIITLGLFFLSLQPRGFVYVLAVAVVVGELLGLIIMMPALIKRGFRFIAAINFKDPALGELIAMMLPAFFGLAIVQVNIAVDLNFANWMGAGTPTYIRFSNRLIQFPLAIFAMSLSTVILPALSRHLLKNELAEVRATINYAMQLAIVIMLPITVGLIALGLPIIELIFQRGRWTAVATSQTYFALIFYALGLLPYTAHRLIIPIYYARQDMITPVKAASVALILNIILNFIFFHFTNLKQGGLALATTIAAAVNFLILYWLITRKFGRLIETNLSLLFVKTLICSVVMGGGCYYCFTMLSSLLPVNLLIVKAIVLCSCIGIGIIVFFILARLARIQVINEVISFLLKYKQKES